MENSVWFDGSKGVRYHRWRRKSSKVEGGVISEGSEFRYCGTWSHSNFRNFGTSCTPSHVSFGILAFCGRPSHGSQANDGVNSLGTRHSAPVADTRRARESRSCPVLLHQQRWPLRSEGTHPRLFSNLLMVREARRLFLHFVDTPNTSTQGCSPLGVG